MVIAIPGQASAAEISCIVNSVAVSGSMISGTSGDDTIRCYEGVARGVSIEAGAGNDSIFVEGEPASGTLGGNGQIGNDGNITAQGIVIAAGGRGGDAMSPGNWDADGGDDGSNSEIYLLGNPDNRAVITGGQGGRASASGEGGNGGHGTDGVTEVTGTADIRGGNGGRAGHQGEKAATEAMATTISSSSPAPPFPPVRSREATAAPDVLAVSPAWATTRPSPATSPHSTAPPAQSSPDPATHTPGGGADHGLT
ncbi:hypothetical protein [Streptomyces goshikiensis]|uniref:hypothetical protein n=1 Tax=Streptomyces goshikiensis TaxID=1942 RepID=UPI0022F3E754|nr:hypothetical protein [Streptomyces goshikiensis]WBY18327.1 hypothetical protein PET44_01070 [Streptomyces goshikiensis]